MHTKIRTRRKTYLGHRQRKDMEMEDEEEEEKEEEEEEEEEKKRKKNLEDKVGFHNKTKETRNAQSVIMSCTRNGSATFAGSDHVASSCTKPSKPLKEKARTAPHGRPQRHGRLHTVQPEVTRGGLCVGSGPVGPVATLTAPAH